MWRRMGRCQRGVPPNKALELTAAYVAFFVRGEKLYCRQRLCRVVLAAAQLERSATLSYGSVCQAPL